MNSLKDLYIEELQDLYSANKQMVKVVEKLHDAASDSDLKAMLKKSLDKIPEHNEQLKQIIEGHGQKATEEHCKGMEGLVKEAKAHGLEKDFGDKAVQDAAIISQMQRMTHYGLAGYGTVQALADTLRLSDDRAKIGDDLDEIYSADKYLSRIAETEVNRDAA